MVFIRRNDYYARAVGMLHRSDEFSQNPPFSRFFLLSGEDLAEKALGFAALFICIELVFFKFLPDVSTAVVQNAKSALADYDAFERYYFTAGTVHYARFLGSRILFSVSRLLGAVFHSEDLRLHPLRLATGLLTPLYAYVGAIAAVQNPGRYSWRSFMLFYSLAIVMGLYVFYPGDVPSLALLSVGLYCLLQGRMAAALVLMLLTGLFRESSLHLVFFVLVWALCAPRRPTAKIAWVGAYSAAFAIEYLAIRHFFRGPVSAGGGLVFDPMVLFLERGMYSLTTICSLGLASIFVLVCLLRLKGAPTSDWRHRFFRLNCWAFPLWIVFYRMLGGNISEFRLTWPVILPCIYGIAWSAVFPRITARAESIRPR